MIKCTRFDAREAIARWIAEWFELLASNRAAEAAARLDEPNCYGARWTVDDIARAVAETFSPDTRYRQSHPDQPRFSRIAETRGDPRLSIGEFDDKSGYHAEHDVPLDGEFGDLTALFEFRWRGDQLAAILHDMHVL